MVNSNLQREHIKSSEKAFAYKMRLEAMKRQGARTDLTLCQVGKRSNNDNPTVVTHKLDLDYGEDGKFEVKQGETVIRSNQELARQIGKI